MAPFDESLPIQVQGPVTKLQEKEGYLIPETPIGQLPIEKVMSATDAELEAFYEERGLEPDKLIAPFYLNPEEWNATRTKDSLTTDEIKRLALLYVDGKSWNELATAFAYRYQNNDIKNVISRLKERVHAGFTRQAKNLAKENRVTRRWHALLSPEDPNVESQLKGLEEKSGLSRDQIFHKKTSRQYYSPRNRMLTVVMKNDGPNVYLLPAAVQILYSRFCEQVPYNDLPYIASKLIGKSVTLGDIDTFFTEVPSEAAKKAFGMRTWKTTKKAA